MSARVHSGVWETVWKPKKASTTFVKNSLVELVSGFVQPCTSSTAEIMGINQDSAYSSGDATTVKIPVLIPKSKGARIQLTTSAILTAGNEYDLVDDVSANAAASTNDAVTCFTALSSTEAICTINKPQLS